MVLKSAFAAAICAGFLALGGAASADEYRAGELLKLDLSKAVFSPKRIGPDAEFAPVAIEAKSDPVVRADVDASVLPKIPARARVVKTRVAKTNVVPARTRLAHRHSNPLDAQAMDTRVQTWPCRSGGICNWQR